MSVEAMTWALHQKTGSTSRKAVLLALADRAGFEWGCWPSQATIADETEMDERSVRRILADLEESGLIARRHRYDSHGKRTSDFTQLNPGTTGQFVRKESVDKSATTGQMERDYRTPEVVLPDTGVRGTILEPSLEPPEPQSVDNLDRVLDEAAGRIVRHREEHGYGRAGPGAFAAARSSLDPVLAKRWLLEGAEEHRVVVSLASRVLEPEMHSTPM